MSIRNMMTLIVLLAVSVSLGPSAAWAEEALCKIDEGDKIVRVDANTGKLFGKKVFPDDTPVTVVFYNKNPFRYDYTWLITSEDIEAQTIRDALSAFGLIPSAFREEESADKGEADAPSQPAAADKSCDDMPGALGMACNEITEAEKLQAASAESEKTAREMLTQAKTAYTSFLALVAKDLDGVPACEDVVGKARELAKNDGSLALLIGLGGLPDVAKSVNKALGHLNIADAILEATDCDALANEAAKQDCKKLRGKKGADGKLDGSLAQRSRASRAILAVLQQSIATEMAKYAGDKAKFQALGQRIGQILGNSQSFVEEVPLPLLGGPTLHRLSIQRAQRGVANAKPESKTVGTIQVGRNRFSITAGIGISFIEEEAFGRQSAPGDDGSTVSRFAVTETSSEHMAGVFQLNARLGSLGKSKGVGFAWSLGAGIAGDDGTTEVSLYTGPSFSFLDDKLFLTFAFHQRDVEELAGFAVGDLVPGDLEGELPTIKKKDDGVLLTITYRFN